MSNSIATVLEQLRLARDSYITALRTLATDAATNNIRPSYSVGGQSVSWPEAHRVATEMIKELTEQINAYSWMDGGTVASYERP